MKRDGADLSAERLTRKRALLLEAFDLLGDAQRRLRRLVAAFLLVEAALIAMHLLVATQLFGFAARAKDSHIGGFDLNDEATVAVWFASFQLLLLAAACLLAAWLDDARLGRLACRRGWKASAALFAFMSVDETGGLHELFGHAMRVLARNVPLSVPEWWAIPYTIALGLFFAFAGRRLARLPGRLALLAGGGASWLIAQFFEHGERFGYVLDVALEEGFELLGGTLILAAVGSLVIRLVRQQRRGAVPSGMKA